MLDNIAYDPSFWWVLGFECISFSLLLLFFPATETEHVRRSTSRSVPTEPAHTHRTNDTPVGAGAPEWVNLLVTFLVLVAVLIGMRTNNTNGGNDGSLDRNYDDFRH